MSSSDQLSQRPVVLHARCISGLGGGPEKTILNSPRFLRPLGFDSYCAYLHSKADGPDLIARANEIKAPFLSVLDNGPFDFGIVKRITEICRAKNVTIWHGHDYKTDLLGLWVRRRWPMKLVTTVHGWVQHTWKTPLYYAIDRFAIRRYDQVICVSEDLYEQCLGMGVSDDRCHLIQNAIDTHEFRRTMSVCDARDAVGWDETTIVLGAVGRLSPEKGFDLLIRAVSQLIDSGVRVCLKIAGEGAEQASLEQLIRELGCTQHVQLIGHVKDIKLFFQAIDIFVLSSLREGLPNVVLESMAMGTPVIATRIAGLPNLIENDHNGKLIDPESVPALYDAIADLAGSPESCDRLSSNARTTIESSFNFEHRMRRVADVYARAIGNPWECPPVDSATNALQQGSNRHIPLSASQR
ncbi:glycosyl transferase, group 1 family protein [Rhodopirellula maiorica SM1]|uniref:Glycosyl transferase, group 1 family protein n=1 Tax=Rhodopirellula maiorica SM1 TaxID=1265738 RepID=M5RAJ7_9BACT|nr:glycosyltransferase family 4 protein [Rhodopirellula maiorica]EMI16523.1 glycosyl transferase, group 1 family protein [Rhodopirellula maiorica SM1]